MTVPATSDWWYVRIYPGQLELLDAATKVCLPWLAQAAETVGATAWFFMRYLDMAGHHLRLRLQADADAVDDLHARLPELKELVEGIGGPGSGTRLVPGAEMMHLTGVPRVRAGLYSPELRKYGGHAGVRVAERLFTTSSRWYLQGDIAALDPRTQRASLAAHLLQATVTAAMPGRETEFWSAHRRQWGMRLRAAAPEQAQFRRLIRETAATITEAGLPGVAASLDDHVAALVAALNDAQGAGVPVARGELLLNYLHMEMNRLGFLPAEECLLGLVAATARHADATSVVSK